jgi:hypothetical protein
VKGRQKYEVKEGVNAIFESTIQKEINFLYFFLLNGKL